MIATAIIRWQRLVARLMVWHQKVGALLPKLSATFRPSCVTSILAPCNAYDFPVQLLVSSG